MSAEPQIVAPEEKFEVALTDACKGILAGADLRYALLPRLGLDIAFLIDHPSGTRWGFVEAKSFSGQRAGGVPVGNQKGGGRQLDILLLSDAELALFDASVRWVLAHARHKPGERRYAIFTCARAKSAVMAGARRDKNNNLRSSDFASELVTWDVLLDHLRSFLIS
jgi:hypothetical protein